jgi:outer membrane protein OmpA-like peptidoglycan-associated protein
MRRFMTSGAWLTGILLMGAALTGCDCCGFKRTVPEAPIVQVEPQPATILPVPPAPVLPPAPVITEAPPVPTPPPPPEPKESVTPAVAKAIKDLGDRYPGLFTFDAARGMFRFNSDITFDSGSSVVKPQAKAALTQLAEILSGDDAKDRQMTIIGYTDTDPVRKAATIAHLKGLGKPATNMGLSEARAEAVAAVLRAGGVASHRMVTKGKGQADPVASNATAAGKAQNRRVEIFLTPMKG